MGKAKTIIVNIAVIAIICIAIIWGNTYYRQRTQFAKGEHALARGDYISAIAGYEAAIHMYTPGSSLVEESAEKLWEMAENFERRGDPERAIITYQALRSSFYAVRGFSVPGSRWISRCDGEIAVLTKEISHGSAD
jgi:tetratricopeptide (TPR) repeat protein